MSWFSFDTKKELITILRKNSDDLYFRLKEVFEDDINSEEIINNAIQDLDDLILEIEHSTDKHLMKKIERALKNY